MVFLSTTGRKIFSSLSKSRADAKSALDKWRKVAKRRERYACFHPVKIITACLNSTALSVKVFCSGIFVMKCLGQKIFRYSSFQLWTFGVPCALRLVRSVLAQIRMPSLHQRRFVPPRLLCLDYVQKQKVAILHSRPPLGYMLDI